MPTKYKIGKTWYLNYPIDGKRIRKKIGRSKEVADTALKDIEVKLAKKEAGLLIQDAKLSEFFEKLYEYSKANHRPKTTIRYREVISNFRKFLKDRPQVKKLSHLKAPLFEQYKSYQTGQ